MLLSQSGLDHEPQNEQRRGWEASRHAPIPRTHRNSAVEIVVSLGLGSVLGLKIIWEAFAQAVDGLAGVFGHAL